MERERAAALMTLDTELSVVVQGPATASLHGVVASVRRWLPGAELIVSTWQDADLAGLDADVVVESEDPGSEPYLDAAGRPTPKTFNTNRMLRSTLAGLRRATRPYAMKMRNDTPLRSRACLAWCRGDAEPRVDDLRIFEQRIVMPNVAVRPADSMKGYLFHPSDIVHIGRRTDLLRLWECELIDERENANWFHHHTRPKLELMPYSWSRFYNEQVLWLACLRRHGIDPGYDFAGHYTQELHALSERSINNNFVCAEPWQLGITLPFGDIMRQFPTWQYRWHHEWRRAVEQLCPT